jgi:hypothetical protein
MLGAIAVDKRVDGLEKLVYELQNRIHKLEKEVADLKSKLQSS